MCFHKSLTQKREDLTEYYQASFDAITEQDEPPFKRWHENGFDFLASPIVTAGKPALLQNFHWGLIPFWTKDHPGAMRLRTQTLNCISEEMYDKPSFKDAAKNGQRCLIPCSGFFEWQWKDEKGKDKIPYYISLKDQPLFSLAGLYSRWRNPETDQYTYTYTVLTSVANPLMATIHNSKKRMPVILPREYEKDWLNPKLTKEDVLAFCAPIDETKMKAHTISKRISSKKDETNVPAVIAEVRYDEMKLF